MTSNCIDCKNSNFKKTPTGRIKHAYGECKAVIAMPNIGCVTFSIRKSAIWPDTKYEICTSFEKIEKEPS